MADALRSEELASELRLTVMRLARRLRRERTDTGLTLSQLSVLGTLDGCGPMTLGALASEEKVSPPSMTRIVKHLLDGGLLSRSSTDGDGRQVVVDLTAAGRDVLEEDRRLRTAWLTERLDELTAGERRALHVAAGIIEKLARM